MENFLRSLCGINFEIEDHVNVSFFFSLLLFIQQMFIWGVLYAGPYDRQREHHGE